MNGLGLDNPMFLILLLLFSGGNGCGCDNCGHKGCGGGDNTLWILILLMLFNGDGCNICRG